MTPSALFLLIFLMGFLTGLRSLTPSTGVAWAAHWGWINLQDTPLAFMSSTVAVVILSVWALVELVIDKQSWSPNRTAPFGLIHRLVFGTLVGTSLAFAGHQNPYLGGLLGVVGAIVGTFVGLQARTRSVKTLRAPDIVIALIEDSMTIAGSLLIVFQFSR